MTLILSGTDGLSDVDGSAATPAIRGTDANTGIFFPAADTIAFAEGGAEVARFDSSGNFGIGTTSPADMLDVKGNARVGQGQVVATSTVGAVGIYSGITSGSGNAQLKFFGKSVDNTGLTYELGRISGGSFGTYGIDGGLSFSTALNNGSNVLTLSERMRLDASGNLLVGATSAISKLTVQGSSDVRATVNESSASVRVDTLAQSGGQGGVGTQSNHRFFFMTNGTERATFDTSGNFLVGTTSASAKLTVVANNASANGSAYIQNDTGTSGSGVLYTNFSNASATTSSYYFLVARNGGGATYVLRADGTMTFSSDVRLKKNIVSSNGYLSRLNQLRPVSYQWNYQKEDDETTSLGLIAQEVEQIFPNLVLEESFVEGEEARKSVKYSELPMMLLKAIQEQQAIITTLTARISALESA
jgi:hypothetical protein